MRWNRRRMVIAALKDRRLTGNRRLFLFPGRQRVVAAAFKGYTNIQKPSTSQYLLVIEFSPIRNPSRFSYRLVIYGFPSPLKQMLF
jgi:hypothetical protein